MATAGEEVAVLPGEALIISDAAAELIREAARRVKPSVTPF